jgi:hypothetical protein
VVTNSVTDVAKSLGFCDCRRRIRHQFGPISGGAVNKSVDFAVSRGGFGGCGELEVVNKSGCCRGERAAFAHVQRRWLGQGDQIGKERSACASWSDVCDCRRGATGASEQIITYGRPISG